MRILGFSWYLLRRLARVVGRVALVVFLLVTLLIWWPLGELIKGYEKYVDEENRK